MPLEYYKCVQFRYRVLIVYGKREGVKGYNTLLWDFTKYASELARIHPLADDPEICVVTCALIGITFGAQRLKIGQIILATVLSRNNVIDLDESFVGRNAT